MIASVLSDSREGCLPPVARLDGFMVRPLRFQYPGVVCHVMARRRRGKGCKSVPVSGSEAVAHDFRIVADFIHLNPARAGLAGGKRGALGAHPSSSLVAKLEMRHPGGVSCLVSLGKADREAVEEGEKPGEMLIREDF